MRQRLLQVVLLSMCCLTLMFVPMLSVRTDIAAVAEIAATASAIDHVLADRILSCSSTFWTWHCVGGIIIFFYFL